LARVSGEHAAGRALLPPDPKRSPTLGPLPEAFLERRKTTHRAAYTDAYRWRKHLAPHFAHLRPAEIDAATVRRYAEAKLAEGLNSGTIRVLVSFLSALFADLVESGIAATNPCHLLPRSTRRLIKPSYDPRTTPFVEKLEDVRRIYLAMPEPVNVAYALGALAGLRTGEVLALRWKHVDLSARRIHLRESVDGPLKDKDSRIVPLLDSLMPILAAWKLKTGGTGRVVPPMRIDGEHLKKYTLYKHLNAALEPLGLPKLEWYEATRRTFASHWVLAGNSIEKLRDVLGHYSVVVTERYAHLRPEHFTSKDLATLALDMRPADGANVQT
jgi:integrase